MPDSRSRSSDSEKKLRTALTMIEVELGLREGFPVDWETERTEEIGESIEGSFERLRHLFRGYLGVDPNG
jgi:hypothetical protein